MRTKLFCEYNSLFYWISTQKERLKRNFHDTLQKTNFASKVSSTPLPIIVNSTRSILLKKLDGVDPTAQKNKVSNLKIALKTISGLIINPGETFSFWERIGKPTQQKGYLSGLTISNGTIGYSIGGGLCQLSNNIHRTVLHSPLQVTEIHHHTDAIFPDYQRRVPFGTGTSVFYNYVDYRFQNTTDQPIQLLIWCDDTDLCVELRTTTPFPYKYRIIEENAYYAKEENDYYRNSEIYRIVKERDTGKEAKKELLLQNHSIVLYDHSKIPPEQIKEV